jgi:hypothetical protein
LNKVKTWKEQIKPFNFFLVGFQAIEENDKAVKPLAPFIRIIRRLSMSRLLIMKQEKLRKDLNISNH